MTTRRRERHKGTIPATRSVVAACIACATYALSASGCAHGSSAASEPTAAELGVEPTSSIGPERLASELPALPLSLGGASENFQRLYEGLEAALSDPMPEPDVSSEAAYRRYVDGELRDWLARRSQALTDAMVRARSLRGTDAAEWIVGSALVGWLYESTATDVIDAPVPGERYRPERSARLRAAWREELAPLLDRAGQLFGACVEAGETAPIEAQRWVELCNEHERRLGPRLREQNDPADAPASDAAPDAPADASTEAR